METTPQPSAWAFQPLSEFKSPAQPARERVRRGLVNVFSDLFKKDAQTPWLAQAEFQSVPQFLLNRVAPEPDLSPAVDELGNYFSAWLAKLRPRQNVQVLVAPPGARLSTIVRRFAEQKGWKIIGAPGGERLLSLTDDWLTSQLNSAGDEPIVIPRLENWYLRHHDGLHFIRTLVDWTESTNKRIMIACDSWTWAYLVRVIDIDTVLPMPHTVQPFDAARLEGWLNSLGKPSRMGQYTVRHMASGEPVFGENSAEMLFRQIAATSRGLPAAALSIWRHGLQMKADEEILRVAPEDIKDDYGYTMWMRPWNNINLPTVPGWVKGDHLFVLHGLLIHGGLTLETLDLITPRSQNEIRRTLARLEDAGLVNVNEKRWRVSHLAYAAVRIHIAQAGYLVDDF